MYPPDSRSFAIVSGAVLSILVCVGGCGHRFVYDPYGTGDGWRPQKTDTADGPPKRSEAPPRESSTRSEPVIAAVVVIKGPTIIGFFPPVTDLELDNDPALSTALDRFTVALEDANGCFAPRGVAVRAAFAEALAIEHNGVQRPLPLGEDSRHIGFYLVTPEGEPRRIDTTARDTASPLPEAASEYFNVPECRRAAPAR
jgi:hypothetical protein